MRKLFTAIMLILFGGVVFLAILTNLTDNVDTLELLQSGFYLVSVPAVTLCILFAMGRMFRKY